MVKRKRLDRYWAERPKERRLKRVVRTLFLDVPANISGYVFSTQEKQMRSWTPEARAKFVKLVSDYEQVVRKRLNEGWVHKRTFWRGDMFTKGNLVFIRDNYNVHVHYLGQHLYEKEFDHRIDALEDFNRIFGNERIVAQFERQGQRWILP